jgi:lysozyme
MRTTKKGIDLIKSFEGLYLKAYVCPAGVNTIGYGTIKYPDGKKVQLGETITMERAEELLKWEISFIEKAIEPIIKDLSLNCYQYDAIVSFAYNCGVNAFKNSTILRRMKKDVNDPTIRDAFMLWTKAKDSKGELRVLKGLVRRRTAEADLYFKTDQ